MARLIRVNFGLREIDTFLNRRLGGALMQFVGWYVPWGLTNFEFAFCNLEFCLPVKVVFFRK